MTMELEDRLWLELEAAAEREDRRGRAGWGVAVTRGALPRPRLLRAGGALAVLAAAIAMLVTVSRPAPQPRWQLGHVTISGTEMSSGATGFGSVWTYDLASGRVLRVDPRAHRVVATIPVRSGSPDTALAVGDGAVWTVPAQQIVHSSPVPPATTPVTLSRIDPRTNRVVARVTLRGLRPIDLAAAGGAVWVWGEAGAQRIDPAHGRATVSIRVPGQRIKGLVATDRRVSVVTDFGRLVTFDAHTGARLAAFPVGAPLFHEELVAIGDAVVVDGQRHGTIESIDTTTGRPRWIARLGSSPLDITLTGGRLWLLMSHELLALDPGNGHIVARVPLTGRDAHGPVPGAAMPLITTVSGDLIVVKPRG